MKNPIPFIGLFLIAIALYANERAQKSAAVSSVSTSAVPIDDPAEKTNPTAKLRNFYNALSSDAALKLDQDGVKLTREFDLIKLEFKGEDLYEDGELGMHESWYSTLEKLAEHIQEQVPAGLKVQIRAYAELNSENERFRTGSGRSEFAFSYMRAEWLARFFESKSRLVLRNTFSMTGAGAVKQGRKIELLFTF